MSRTPAVRCDAPTPDRADSTAETGHCYLHAGHHGPHAAVTVTEPDWRAVVHRWDTTRTAA